MSTFPVRRVRHVAILLCLGLAAGDAAMATEGEAGAIMDRAALQRAYRSTFQEMLRRPADLDVVFRYTELAIRLENYEGAIAALERLLLFNPDLPRVRLELGTLYYRLGSYDLARSYLVRALEDEAVPEPVRARARIYLDAIEERTARHRIDGTLFVGGRWHRSPASQV